ncbi:2-C-methyl-D-erythritol 4-phosphate cytidylyltransferase [Oxalobacteraceae bacterium OM1]|nr:2-C-methyl-D-erythritol 4-phosphate cytidylyltransferase [Oxalobacteraceae bacterium OM1]
MPGTPSPRHVALIPAAGVGARMGADMPKQYLPVAGKPMLRHVVEAFDAMDAIAHTFVVVSAEDGYAEALWREMRPRKATLLRAGGPTRHASVLNGLVAMGEQAGADDWVLVHDAARPGLTAALVQHLIDALRDDPVGGLLALPVVDTLKRSAGGRAETTVPREALWAAQTPQMFRYALLRQALETAESVTDEASAIEALGLQPKLVEGSPRNFKVTLPHDVALAELYLKGLA